MTHDAHSREVALRLLGAVLAIVGVVFIFTDRSTALAFAFMGVGGALTAIAEANKRWRTRSGH